MIYLDYAATTPLEPLVLEAMLPYLQENYGNPSSLHQLGQKARRGVETAREQIAAAIGAKPKEIIFTAGATEAINHALRAVAKQHPGKAIITSQLEHAAVLETCRYLETQGHLVTYLPPAASGEIKLETLQQTLTQDTCLVVLMRTNNEIGVQTDSAAISQIVHEAGALFFCDAVQAFGFEKVNVRELGVDFLCLSAHKFYGPKGVGVLYIREGLELEPFLLGGSQERGLRAGTHNVAAIAGMGKAAELAAQRQENLSQDLSKLRDLFESKVKTIEGISINGSAAPRGPKHSNIRVAGVDGEALLFNLDNLGVCASAGSACAAGSLEPSHVLSAMGLADAEAKASIRFSFGLGITQADVLSAAERFAQAIARCRVYA
jgi:cysteine desulfurase